MDHSSNRHGSCEALPALLAQLSELVRYAQDTMQLDAEDAQVFMPLYAVVMYGVIDGGAADPILWQLAESAIGRTDLSATRGQQGTAARLLVTVWSASLQPAVEAKEWPVKAPDLPLQCLRAAVASADAADSGEKGSAA
ncbi:hypothetical protein ACFW9L_31710 [Streptomyces sp. NPDC059517]|uniref:hypothetical protein n=1 Tax=Streptomyces sp. NPDC059517 TaxID=3346855 RepID=UPI0036932035